MIDRLQLAIQICTKIEPALRANGMHCALTGSTLYGLGKTDKDIDVIIYPNNHEIDGRCPIDVDFLHGILKLVLGTVYKNADADYADADYADVLRYYNGGILDKDMVRFDFIPVPVPPVGTPVVPRTIAPWEASK